MKNDKLKQLRMALTDQKTLIFKNKGIPTFRMVFDKKINTYRGISIENNIQMGIWDMELLIDIVNEKYENYRLELEEDNEKSI